MDSLHQGHRKRLRDRFIKNGLDCFEPHEVLELLLFSTIPRQDTNPVAHNLLNKYGGESSAFLIHLLPEISRYVSIYETEKERSLGTVEKLGGFAVDLCRGKKDESLFVICLDSNRNLKDYKLLEEGGVNRVELDVRKIAQYAMNQQATNLVLVHNHPNGSCVPSFNDKKSTYSAVGDLSRFSIKIIDHIVVSGEQYYSMKEMGDFSLF